MGYAGGTSPSPTYQDIGDHAECLQIDFDSREISFAGLLEKFFEWHNAFRKPYARQYMSAVLLHDEEQRLAWRQAVVAREDELHKVLSEVQDFSHFTWAEDYHQKYYLRKNRSLTLELKSRFPSSEEFVNSTAATKANAILAGHLILSEDDLEELGFSAEARNQLLARKKSFFGQIFGSILPSH